MTPASIAVKRLFKDIAECRLRLRSSHSETRLTDAFRRALTGRALSQPTASSVVVSLSNNHEAWCRFPEILEDILT